MNFITGKISHYRGKHNGNITGASFPRDSLNHDINLEINYSKLPGDFKAPKHLHSKTKTLVIVTRGKMFFNVDGQKVELGAGDFLIFPKNIAEEVIKVEPGTESITIHAPSIQGGDKIVLN